MKVSRGSWVAVFAVVAMVIGVFATSRGGAAGVAEHAGVSFQHVPGQPFGVAVTPDDRFAFVDLLGGGPKQAPRPRNASPARGHVLVYSLAHGAPTLIRSITVPGEAVGASLTSGGRFLLVAGGQGAAVVSVARAERGEAHPVLGTLRPPASAHLRAAGAIETTSSADGRYVFVSLEYGNTGGAIAVYDLGTGQRPRLGAAGYVRSITLGEAVVGSALSADGRDLYVTSELAGNPMASGRPGSNALQSDGTLSVIDVNAAQRASVHAVIATVPAGRQPVRVAVSPNGAIIWVTSRASNSLLAFSASGLLTNPTTALLATVKVGTAPVGLAVFDHGDRIIVADSDRFSSRGEHAALTIVDTRAALAQRPAVLATVRSGRFPREIAIDQSDQTALVTNFASDQVETVQLRRFR